MQPDNLEILVNHLKCAAFELPTRGGRKVRRRGCRSDLCERLEEAGFLHRTGDHWHWTQQAYPADTVSLRAVTSDNFVIVDTTAATEVIGEVDFASALTTVHPKAVYLHQGQQYHVEAPGLRRAPRLREARGPRVLHRRHPLYAGARAGSGGTASAGARRGTRRSISRAHLMATCWSARRWSASRRSNSSPTKIWAPDSSNCRKTKCTPRRSG